MATWTNVPDSNLEPGDPIRSVDIIAIKENTVYNYQHTTLEILNQQTFTSSTTWTKPGGFDATDSVVAVMIGGGASGSIDFSNPGSGGAGGGVCVVSVSYGSVTSTVSVTVGAGGAAATWAGSPLPGNAGGKSTFGTYAGASGGAITGSGGGALINASSTTPTLGLINGGGGRSGNDGTFVDGFTGGGGGFNTNNAYVTGVTSQFFGSGGNAATWTGGLPTAGTAPGGGGGAGGSLTNVSGAGARGEVRVYIVRGKVSANTFLGSLTLNIAY